MTNALIRKLQHGAELSQEDRSALTAAVAYSRNVPAREDLICEGDRPDHVHVMLAGFACRYKILPDGGRQIMAWLAPGDFCDLHVALLGEMDHSIATISASEVAFISRQAVTDLTRRSPALTRALWWATLVDEGILREWLVNMGRRPADKKIAHLFCELLVRLQAVGLAPGDVIDLPISQVELADTVGLSSVHVNRMIQQLRDENYITWQGTRLAITDAPRLKAFAGFDANYLHLVPPRPEHNYP
jgi:CRP-like cAMP-binding protein